jgi:hypothetical protein
MHGSGIRESARHMLDHTYAVSGPPAYRDRCREV